MSNSPIVYGLECQKYQKPFEGKVQNKSGAALNYCAVQYNCLYTFLIYLSFKFV